MTKTLRSWLRATPFVLGCMLMAASATAQDNVPMAENGFAAGQHGAYAVPQQLNPDVFYNMYPNTYAGATSANLYVAPLPVPANVGHTYYTYQPLMPHEYMYAHKRVYYTPYGAGAFHAQDHRGCPLGNTDGLNKTTVTWYSGAYHFGTAPFGIFPMENIRRLGAGLRGSGGCNTCR